MAQLYAGGKYVLNQPLLRSFVWPDEYYKASIGELIYANRGYATLPEGTGLTCLRHDNGVGLMIVTSCTDVTLEREWFVISDQTAGVKLNSIQF